jgi:hypothetical protein
MTASFFIPSPFSPERLSPPPPGGEVLHWSRKYKTALYVAAAQKLPLPVKGAARNLAIAPARGARSASCSIKEFKRHPRIYQESFPENWRVDGIAEGGERSAQGCQPKTQALENQGFV